MSSINLYKPPTTRDGRPIMLPSTIGDNEDVQFTGSGDDITNGTRFEGTKFHANVTTQGESSYEWQFMEWVDINGGGVNAHACVRSDYIHYQIYSPATASTVESGDFDKHNLGGPYNMYIPATPGQGAYSIDLEETLNSNVGFTKAVPVPANGTGYFDYDMDANTLTVDYAGTGDYNLFDFSIILTRIVNYFPLMGDVDKNSFVVPASYGAKRLLPHFKHKMIINVSAASPDIDLIWWLFLGRAFTQP